MDIASIFSDYEVQNLRLSIIRVFNIVADSDGKIDKKEMVSLDLILTKSKKFECDLARQVFAESLSKEALQEQSSMSVLKDREGLRYVSALLDRKVEREQAMSFKKTMLAVGYYVASASGCFLQDKISDDETSALNMIAKDLDLPLRELLSSNQLKNIIEKIVS